MNKIIEEKCSKVLFDLEKFIVSRADTYRPKKNMTASASHLVYFTICFAVIVIMFNISAVVDFFLYSEVPYFDVSHLVTGIISSVITAVLLAVLLYYICHLKRTAKRIELLESYLSICSFCKKVRESSLPSDDVTAWQEIELFLSERIDSKFSHGICPDCYKKFYSQFSK